MNKIKSSLAALILIVSVVGLSGCASPVSKKSVVVHSIPGVQEHQSTVSINTQGGSETSALDSSNISDSEFEKAIEESVIANKVFSRVVHGDDSDYLLNVTIVSMSKPLFGSSFTVDMEAAWSFSNPQNEEFLLKKLVTSSHTVTMGEAFYGATRLRLAIEGAVRKNIKSGLKSISELPLE